MPDGDSRPALVVTITDESGRPLRVAGLAAWLRRVAPARARGVVSLALVDDDTMRQFNRRFAGTNRATDVLSFPASPAPPAARRTPQAGVPVLLGDIVIAMGVAARQASERGHSLGHELKVLALHGLLHLLGYDHHEDGGRMARAEARLRRKGGLREGLIERARAR